MNPFNLLINYVIANSRASFYNVPENQEITNTALLTGVVSENPLMSYLIIDNKAKIEGEKFTSATVTVPEVLNLPATSGTVINSPTETTGSETPTEGNTVTLETIRAEISNCNTALATISKEVADLKSNITNIETDNKKLNVAVSEIQTKLSEISIAKQVPDTATASKNIVTQKAATKTDTK